MIDTTASIYINRPLADVFALTTDPKHFSFWMPGVASTRWESNEKLENDSRFTQYLRLGESLAQCTGTIVKFNKNKTWTYIGIGPNMWFRRTWVFEPTREGTWVHYTENRIRPGLMYNLVAPFVKASFQKISEEGCQNLKSFIMSHHPEAKSMKVA